VESWAGVRKFAAACGASIPPSLAQAFDNATRDGTADLLATAVATSLCDRLLQGGVDHLHFYTLNRPELTRDVCHALGITPRARLREVA
jgi:methylenetetrahydrofolate reductase (NADPH)